MKSKTTLPTICWQMVKESINQPGWALTPKIIVAAGTLDSSDRIPIAPIPQPLTLEAEKAWADVEVSVELTDNEREAISKAIQYNLEKGAFRGNKYSKRLIETFLPVTP